MKSRSSLEIRRCRPLLGTFVEICVSGQAEGDFNGAINAAFATIERIQERMSAHDAESELSRLNREAALRPVTVSRETFEVLRRADKLAAESGGAFDYTVAPLLARWNFLPASLKREKAGSWRDVLLAHGRTVSFLQPLALDLGGIAKGYAVDKAIKTLRRRGVSAAVVNAGGDLRVFGEQPSTVHVRHPADPQTFAHKVSICDAALATSAPRFTERIWRGAAGGPPLRVSHLVDPLRQGAVTGVVSVTVRAHECWLADALTKVVLNAPCLARKLLGKHCAEAFVLTA